jgi:hypothetical protein
VVVVALASLLMMRVIARRPFSAPSW